MRLGLRRFGTLGGSVQPSFTLADTGIAPNTPAITVVRSAAAVAVAPLITALFKNTSEVVGGSDYQNEVHIRLQAGTAANHRRYLNFAGYDGADDWLTGVSASDTWILYEDHTPVHRLWFNTTANGGDGHSYISSALSGSVIINGNTDSTGNSGTGGLIIRDGGASPATIYDMAGTGTFTIGQAGASTRYKQYVYGTYTDISGGSVGGLFLQPIFSPTADAGIAMNGIYSNPKSAGSFNASSIVGAQVVGTHAASATLTAAYGGNFVAENTVGQTVTTAYGGAFQVRNTHASGTVSTGYGVYVFSPSNSGTLTNYHGVRVLDATAATLTTAFRGGITSGTGKWNLYLDGTANNAIAGNTYLGGTTAPTALIHLAAGSTTRAQMRFVEGVEPTSKNDGDTWREGHVLHTYFNGVEYTIDMTVVV